MLHLPVDIITTDASGLGKRFAVHTYQYKSSLIYNIDLYSIV